MESVSAHQTRIAQLLGKAKAQPLSEIQLEESGVILNGHFRLRGNQHSRKGLKFTPDFFESEIGKQVVWGFIEQLRMSGGIKLGKVEVVVGPKTSGAILAMKIAGNLECDFAAVDKDPSKDIAYSLTDAAVAAISSKSILVVDDDWNTGITLVGIVMPILRSAGAKVIGVAVLANRGNASLPVNCAFEEYWKISSGECFPPHLCPMCIAGEPYTEL